MIPLEASGNGRPDMSSGPNETCVHLTGDTVVKMLEHCIEQTKKVTASELEKVRREREAVSA